jgi:hypothetical protein
VEKKGRKKTVHGATVSVGQSSTFLEYQHATRLWNQVEKLLERLLGPHNINRKIVIFGYQRFDSTAYQLANFVIIMAKSTINKTYMASADEEGRTPNYYRLLMMRLKYRLHLELHRSIMDNDTDRFQNYWKTTMYNNKKNLSISIITGQLGGQIRLI